MNKAVIQEVLATKGIEVPFNLRKNELILLALEAGI
jgi:hypothetical protein